MSKIVGIDLGTTNSAVAFVQAGKPEVITNKEGLRTTPSVVAIDVDNSSEIVGITAKNQMVTNPEQTFYSVKRLIGLKYDDPAVQKDLKLLPFETQKASKGGVEIKMDEKWVTPEEVSAKVLAKIKTDAEAFLGETVKKAVITVPAYFDDSQRQATKNAGEIAGLEVERIINEPTAAAIAYGLDKEHDHTIVVYDLGGGTFDVTVLEIGDGVYEVQSTSGDTHLGGDDFDQALIDHFVEEFKKEQGIDLKEDPAALQRLKEAAEKAKIALSSSEQTEINLPYITADAKGPKHFRMNLTKADFEKLVSGLIDKTFESVDKALKDADMNKSDVHEIVMVGGMTRMPLVKQKVKDYFGKEANYSVNPDEVVAVGAALQGAVLAGDEDVDDITLLDVTPLSLGIEVNMGEMHILIPRNTTIPTEKSEDRFTTGADNQPAIDVKVLQGERPLAKDNKVIGEFRMDGLPPAPKGTPKFEVTFKIDANGILNVKAKDLGTGKEQDITIKASTQLEQGEIDKLVKEAAENEAADKAELEKLQVRNTADSMLHQADSMLKDHGEKLGDDGKKAIEEKKKEVEDAMKSYDEAVSKEGEEAEKERETLKEKTDELMKEMQEQSSKIYEAAGGDASEGEANSSKDEANSEQADTNSGENKDGDADAKDKKDDKDKSAEEGEIVE